MFRMMSILVAEVQTARTGKRRKLLSLTRFGYQTFLLTFLIKIGDIIIDLFHIIIFLAIADPGGFK